MTNPPSPPEKKKRGWNGGRKPAGAEVASANLHLRVITARRDAWRRAAEAAGKSLTAWISEKCDQAAGEK